MHTVRETCCCDASFEVESSNSVFIKYRQLEFHEQHKNCIKTKSEAIPCVLDTTIHEGYTTKNDYIYKLEALLLESNNALRSCASIVGREGYSTNYWDAIKKIITDILERQHEITNSIRKKIIEVKTNEH